jgi:hypothetical protein
MVGYRAYIEADMETGLGVVVLVNGPSDEVPWEPESMGHYALRLLRASRKGTDLPDPPIDRSNLIENTGDYAGVYHSGEKTFALSARDRHLILECDSDHAQLVPRGRDQFFVDHADLDRFLLSFGRRDGDVVEAFHGPDWYNREGQTRAPTGDYPQTWSAYPGHYRAHNPWYSNFRVVLRKGALVLIYPSGEEEALIPLSNHTFRVGEEPRSPERIRFDRLHRGLTYRSYLSGGEYCRTFTP